MSDEENPGKLRPSGGIKAGASCHLETHDTDSSSGAGIDAWPPIKGPLRGGGAGLVWVCSNSRGLQPSILFCFEQEYLCETGIVLNFGEEPACV